jgi:hypothetical protein
MQAGPDTHVNKKKYKDKSEKKKNEIDKKKNLSTHLIT